MLKIQKILRKQSNKHVKSSLVFFDLTRKNDQNELEKYFIKKKIDFVSDEYIVQQEEYFQVMNPTLVYHPSFKDEFKKYIKKINKEKPLWQQGKWVYYPWRSHLIHILDEEAYFKVRTARNKNLINEKEQDNYYNAIVGIAGLSVGNSVALAIVLQGGAKHIKLADFDTLELSNTNRIRTGIDALGLPKVEMTTREIYLLNPYAKIELFKGGLTKQNIEKFFKGLDIVVDEIDNLAIKYLIRHHAKKNKIAVVMAADNGDNAVVDIERYDKKKQPEFFHGRMGKVSYSKLNNLDKFGIGKTITKHVGPENVTEKMQQSLLQMGKTIVSWPQLGGAALINGSAVAYCVRKIVNKQSLEKNRALISLDEKLIPRFNSKHSIQERRKVSNGFKKKLGL